MIGDCGNREERLVALLYEDGDRAELAESRAHLTTCARCREEFERLTATRELLGAWSEVVDAPGAVHVEEPAASLAGRGRRGASRSGWGGFRTFLPSLAAAAAVVLVLAASATVLRFQVAPDGRLRVGFAGSPAPVAAGAGFVTRRDLDQGLAQTAEYLEALVRSAREQDRQALLGAVDEVLGDQNASMGEQVTRAIDSAFDELDRRRRADLGVLLSSMDDLQVITTTELQRINAILASLTPPSGADQE